MSLARTFGHIPGYPVGSCFGTRLALSQAGVHRPRIAGIAGRGPLGANSVALAGGYEDTEDHGDVVFYTGQGGRDPESGRQIAHQTLTQGNLALAYSQWRALPVRLTRGARHPSPYAPPAGYCYDGLYLVDEHWQEPGKPQQRGLSQADWSPLIHGPGGDHRVPRG
jgi:putative restriction endonuclease